MTKFSGAFTLQAQMQNASASTWPRVPGAPTIGTASVVTGTQASVTFTPPSDLGIGTIVYTATSNPGGITGTSTSSPVTVSGLTANSTYTFTVTATTSGGTGPASAASNSITMIVQGQQQYTTPGTYSWIAPSGVTSVSVFAVGGGGGGGICSSQGGGGGGGGGTAYMNNFSVTPGTAYAVIVGDRGVIGSSGTAGGKSTFDGDSRVRGNGGNPGSGQSVVALVVEVVYVVLEQLVLVDQEALLRAV
jgi:hypothetical protein